MAKAGEITVHIADLPEVKALIGKLNDALMKVAQIRDDLNETLHADEVVDPIGCLETLLIQLKQALGEDT